MNDMTIIREDDLIESVADALQYISYYHPMDYIKALGEAYEAEQGTAACHELSPLSVLNPPDSTDKKGDSPLGSFDSSIMNGTIYAGLFGTAVAAYEVSPLAACTIASTIAKNSRFSADCLPVRPPRINPCMSP